MVKIIRADELMRATRHKPRPASTSREDPEEIPVGYEPDFEEFARSLDLTQALFLHANLQGSKAKAYYPLREALLNRILSSPINTGRMSMMVERFYRPIHQKRAGKDGNGRTD
jgi:hypothetical protein